MNELAPGVAVLKMSIVNAFLVGEREAWVLIDSGVKGSAGAILRGVAERFGPDARPAAIVLTHGHFDHAGGSPALARRWDVPIYAHRMEWPYLTGKSKYPPLDPTAPGFFSAVSRLFPSSSSVDLRGRLRQLGEDLSAFGLPEWTVHRTPGHSPGHVSFFRERDRLLIAGDAVTTVNLDSAVDLFARKVELCRPPTPATPDWNAARDSVRYLATLGPTAIAAGHGDPLKHDAAEQLSRLAERFSVPSHGRYVGKPASMDENGVVSLPPKPLDVVPIVGGVVIGLAAVATLAWRSGSRRRNLVFQKSRRAIIG